MNNLDKGYTCACCGSFVKRYTRSFNSNMALSLLVMYKYSNGEFVKVEDLLLEKGFKRCGDFSYLRHYGFIEPFLGKREDGSNRNGFYKITEKGIDFITSPAPVIIKDKFIILNNKLEGFVDGSYTTFEKALSKKFNYEKLMQS